MYKGDNRDDMTIVAALEGESDARQVLGEANELSETFGEELHVVHVAGQYESTEQIRRSSQAHLGEAIDTDKPQKQAEARAEQLASGIVEEFIPVGRVGYPAQEITEYSDEQAARYVVIGGRKQSPVGKVLFGSVAQAVLLEADQSVVSVRLPETK